jgi:hypothetical protein
VIGLSTVVSMLTGGTVKKLLFGLLGGLLIAAALAYGAWRCWHAGYDAADLKRRAEVADIRAAHSRALAEAEAEARRALEAATDRGNALAAGLLAARKTINRQANELTKARIAHASRPVVTADGALRVGPEWVRAYNQAIGAGPGDGGRSLPAAAPGPAGAPGTAQTPDPGLLRGGGTVTLADILAHARDYGQRNRAMEAQLGALIDWAEGLSEVVP